MSRIIIFGLDNLSVGEIHANCNRSWIINDSGQTTVDLAASNVLPVIDLGRMVLIEHAKLPSWVGVIDTPWKAILPAQMTVYNAGYLLHIRAPETAQALIGTTGAIVSTLINNSNSLENLFLLPGDVDFDDAKRSEPFDRRDYWTQIQDLVKRADMEIQFRPLRDAYNRLIIYVDVKRRLGIDTQFLLHDGSGGNIEITDAKIYNEVWNRVSGYGSQQTPVTGAAQVDAISISRYRLRSKFIQYQSDTVSVLNQNALLEVKNDQPTLMLTVNALDVGNTFYNLRLGNWVIVRASKLYLPAGVLGWQGSARITAMAFDEANNKVGLTLEAPL